MRSICADDQLERERQSLHTSLLPTAISMARNVLALILAIACMHAAHAQNATERTITVTGNGALQRQSDTATVRPPVG